MPINRQFGHAEFRRLLRAVRRRWTLERRPRQHARRDHLLLLFLGRTGLRVGEALALRAEDLVLDHDPPFLRVVTAKRRRPQAADEVYLEPDLARRLRAYLVGTGPRSLHRELEPKEKLFPMSRRNAQRIFYAACRDAGLKGYSIHALRHYRGSTLYQATRDLEFTRAQLRHRHIRTTGIYLHTDPGQVRGYLKRLEALRQAHQEEQAP